MNVFILTSVYSDSTDGLECEDIVAQVLDGGEPFLSLDAAQKEAQFEAQSDYEFDNRPELECEDDDIHIVWEFQPTTCAPGSHNEWTGTVKIKPEYDAVRSYPYDLTFRIREFDIG